MKTNRLFRIDPTRAGVFYTVFKKCNVFTLLLEDSLVPVYDFSGNNYHSSLNSLRKFYPGSNVKFYAEASIHSQSVLPRPYSLFYPNCIVFF